jgi:hypothetical protein
MHVAGNFRQEETFTKYGHLVLLAKYLSSANDYIEDNYSDLYCIDEK